MSNWTNIDLIYLYDGTFEGFLTCIFDAFSKKQIPYLIKSSKEFTSSILYSSLYTKTDFDKSSRVFNGILNLSDLVMYYTHNVFLSYHENKEILLLNYLIQAFKYGPNINNMLTLNEVLTVQKISKTVTFEIQRLKGFVRFHEIKENLFFSEIEPDNNILEILCEHFKKRLPSQNFMIYDSKRKLIGAYNTKELILTDCDNLPAIKISKIEKQYEEMWKMFFKTIAIKERTNSRLQRQYMPKRYWKHMLENN